jgi:hypothetical protein
MQLLSQLKEVGYEKVRGAVALLALSLFGLQYLLLGLVGPPEWRPAFLGLALCYLVAFFGVASEWFWARWYASGLGWSGAMVGLVGLVSLGWHPILALFGGLHAIVVAMMLGPKMAARYEQQEAWRKRYNMDEHGVSRLGKAVTRASASLPSLILWALAPKDGQALWLTGAVAASAALLGVYGLVRMRGWAIPALGVAALGSLGLVILGVPVSGLREFPAPAANMMLCHPGVAFGMTLAALAPLVQPALRFLRGLPR